MKKDYDKDEDYDNWFPQKKDIDKRKNSPTFEKREVWWCQIGVNIGYEIFGIGEVFTRPVLVLKKYSDFTFLGAALSTKKVRSKLHVPVSVGGKQGIVRLDQIRTYDARRLQRRVKAPFLVTKAQFADIKWILKKNL